MNSFQEAMNQAPVDEKSIMDDGFIDDDFSVGSGSISFSWLESEIDKSPPTQTTVPEDTLLTTVITCPSHCHEQFKLRGSLEESSSTSTLQDIALLFSTKKPFQASTKRKSDSFENVDEHNLAQKIQRLAPPCRPENTCDILSRCLKTEKPSSWIRASKIYHSGCGSPVANNAETAVDHPFALHMACAKGETDQIRRYVQKRRDSAGKAASAADIKTIYAQNKNLSFFRGTRAEYTYPLNIAIQNNDVDVATLELLIQAAPKVMVQPDGNQRECSLAVLLKYRPHETALAQMMLAKNPNCIFFMDRRLNSVLHIACSFGASLEIIRNMCSLHPEGLHKRNFFGQTPIDLARHSSSECSDQVSYYLLCKGSCVK